MPKHLSARLAWHMDSWNGRIYQKCCSRTHRVAQSRGETPRLVPGEPVEGAIVVLDDAVTVEESRKVLWCNKEETGERFVEGAAPNSVLACNWKRWGMLVFDEPRQQEAAECSFQSLLKQAA